MVFGNIVSSPRGSLPPQKALELANIYLENAFNAVDSDIALVLCHDTELSLYQAKKSVKPDKNQTLAKGIVTAYIGLGKLLEDRGHVGGAQASFKKAEKLGGNIHDLERPIGTYRPSSIMESLKETSDSAGRSQDVELVKTPPLDQQVDATVPAEIFAENIQPPTVQVKLPEPDARIDNTPQLVSCLGLLKVARSSDVKLEPIALKWMQTIDKDTEEQERLKRLATDVIREFKEEKIKDAKVVAEVVCLAPILDKDTFHDLLRELYTGVDHSGLLNFQELEGLAQLIQGADHGHLGADDLIKILELLSTRLKNTHQQPSEHMYQLTMAVSHVLDAMADTKVTDLDRVKLHEPLFSYLGSLKRSPDPFLKYQGAYAHQALLNIPDDETKWQAATRRTIKVIQGVSGMAGAVNAADPTKLVKGLQDILKGMSGGSELSDVFDAAKSMYDKVTLLIEDGRNIKDALKEGLSFERKRAWYPALREADVMIRGGELDNFKTLVCEAPCRYDPAFQWGVCQRLGEMAANPKWHETTRRNAIAFLGEIYKNDKAWRLRDENKKWILNILMQLSSSTGGSSQLHSAVAGALLRELEASNDIQKRVLYQTCLENGPIAYPLKITLPELASPSLLDRVQNRPDVEAPLRILRRQRTRERRNAVYIQPQAKSSLQAADDIRFPLMDKVEEFLSSEQRVFLLLGDSGAGKSTFSRHLEFELWKSYKINAGRIPLHINLPTIDKPEIDMIAKQLRRDEFTEPQIRELKHNHKFILICDGYDESQQTQNLYMSNRLSQPGEWDALMVISCRSEYLGSDYRARFQPGDRNQQSDSPLFQEAVITPFSTSQIKDYIKQYVSVNQPLWHEKDYEQALDLIPSLKDLVKNPFLMALSLDVLPRMVDPGPQLSSAHITRVALYDHFVEQWLERGKKRLAEKDMSPLTKEAFEKLSAEGFTLNGIEYLKRFSSAIYKEQGGQPVVKYSQLIDEGSWKDAFFSSKEKQLLHEACPLTRNGNQHRFIHRSLLEYGLARAVFDPQNKKDRTALEPELSRRRSVSSTLSFEVHGSDEEVTANAEQEPDPSSPLVWRSFVNDYSLLQFLEERVQQEPVFKDQLLAYIEHSKKDKKWRTAAANAITILVRAGVHFIGTDLRGIRIPGADLSYGVFDSVEMQEADLRKVNLRGAWLRKTDLRKADMNGVQFGELPYLTGDSSIRSCAFSPDGMSLVTGLDDGKINLYSTTNWEGIRTLNGHDSAVRKVAYSPDGKLIVSGCNGGTVRVWFLESGVCRHDLKGHTDYVLGVAYSPHGDRVASASSDKTIRLWDPESGNCCQILSGHEEGVLCVVYSPKGDQIASGSIDSTVRLWNVATSECSHILVGHRNLIWDISFSPKGNQVASSSRDMTIRLWDVESGKCRHILKGHTNEVNCILYSLKGDQVFSGSHDGTVRVWDAQSGACRHAWAGHAEGVTGVALSPKGDMVVSCSYDCTVRLWDVTVGGSRHISSGHSQQVTDVKFSPNGNIIASGSWDSTIRIWDSNTGTCLRTLNGHENSVSSIAFSPQGNRIASGSHDNTVCLWNMDTGTYQRIFTGHAANVFRIAYSPQGDRVASAGRDNTIRLWNTTTGEYCGALIGNNDKLDQVVYSPDGSLIATGSSEGAVRLWNVGTLACINTFKGHNDWVNDVVFSPRGDQLASASDRTVCLWNVETGNRCWILIGHGDLVSSVAYSHKGDLLASGSWDKTVRIWDVASGQCRAVVRNFQGAVTGVAWIPSSDADYLVTGSKDGSVLKWQVIEEEEQCHVKLCWCATGGSLAMTGSSIQDVHGLTSINKHLLRQRGAEGEPDNPFRGAGKNLITMTSVVSRLRKHSGRMVPGSSSIANNSDEQLQQQDEQNRTDMTGVKFGELSHIAVSSTTYSCEFSPDGESLAFSLNGGDINVHSTTNWEVIHTLNGHSDTVLKVSFSPDGNLIVSGSHDKTVRIWDMESGACQSILIGHADGVNCVAFSPRGDRIASASDDKTIRLWDPASGNCCQILFGHEKGVYYVVYSPKGDRIASGSTDFTLRLWDTVTGECSHILIGHSDIVGSIAFSPQGGQVASASDDRTIRLWDVESGECRRIIEGHIDEVWCVKYSLEGDQIFSGGKDKTVRVWDVQSGTCCHTMTGHTSGVTGVALSLKGDVVATTSWDNTLRLWVDCHSQEVKDLKCSPNGNLIASCSDDRTIRLWDSKRVTPSRILSGHRSAILCIAFSPQGNQIGSGSADNTVRLWNIETGTCQHILTGHTDNVHSIGYSPEGDKVASASHDKTVRLWNALTGELCRSFNGLLVEVMRVMYSPGGNLIAIGSDDGAVQLWSVGTMTCINTFKGHRGTIKDVVFSPQGDQLASAGGDQAVRVWNVVTGECRSILLGHVHEALNLAYSPNGDLLASSGRDKTLRIWDVASGQCRAVVRDFQEAVTSIAWIPSTDINYLVTGCGDGLVLRWQVTEGEGQCHVKRWSITGGLIATRASESRGKEQDESKGEEQVELGGEDQDELHGGQQDE